jgi:hypothetical protein
MKEQSKLVAFKIILPTFAQVYNTSDIPSNFQGACIYLTVALRLILTSKNENFPLKVLFCLY